MKRTVTNGLIMATYSGSIMYGTNRPDSDVDIRGVCFSPIEAIVGLSPFEQYKPSGDEAIGFTSETFGIESDDIQIYSIGKFFKLLLDANPNIIELLFTNSYLYNSATWLRICTNKKLFLSNKIIHTFSGYAYAQLVKIERHKRWLDNPVVKPNPHKYGLYTDKNGADKWDDPRQMKRYKADQIEYKNYSTWRKNRNPARAELEKKHNYDTKCALHLYRLIMEAENLLKTGYIQLPLCDPDIRTLKNILNGGEKYEDVVEMARNAHDYLVSLESSSVLPHSPNRKKAEKLLMELQLGWIEQWI